MVESNIVSLFNPRSADAPAASGDDCVGCMTVQLLTALGLGTYLQTGGLFKENGTIDYKKHPVLWQRSVRGVGVGLIGFGFYRAWNTFKLAQEKK